MKQGNVHFFHRYWIKRGSKYIHRKEYAGNSLTEAQAVEGKRKAQKIEGVLEKIPDKKFTFNELSEWFLDLPSVQRLKYYGTLIYLINAFCQEFGDTLVGDITPESLREYQIMRKDSGLPDCYIDQHLTAAKTLNRAIENDKIM